MGFTELNQLGQVSQRRLRRYLHLGTVISHIDYANAIFIGLPKCSIKKLQRIQNMAARVVLGAELNHLSSIQCLIKLHWLPLELWIQFKILVLVFKALHNSSPDYMKSMLIESKPQRVLRSNNIYKKLEVPSVKRKTFAGRAFSVQGPLWWNEIPNNIKMSETEDIFKSKLKTYLFNRF